METKHFPVVVIGAGQAGLCASYWLKQSGIRHVVLERSEAFHAWKYERWDSFCLVTPNWQCQLSGFPYAGPEPYGFMVKSDVIRYLEDYCRFVDPPLWTGVEVTSVEVTNAEVTSAGPRASSGYLVTTSRGPISAACVVVCTGPYHTPIVPEWSRLLPPHVVQIHSRDYKGPSQVASDAVLVVGSGQSGCQIAEELHFAGKKVHLCLGDAPRSPRVYRGKDVVEWLDQIGYYDTPVEAHPDVDATRDKTNHYLSGRNGGHEIDLRRLALGGMRLYGYLEGIESGVCRIRPDSGAKLDAADVVYNGIRAMVDKHIERSGILAPVEPAYVPPWAPAVEPTQLDLAAEGIGAVIWSIGFRPDFRMIRVPALGERDMPEHRRGVTAAPGLYFLGLPWLYTWGSARMSAVGRDASHVVGHLCQYLAELEGAV